MISETHSLYFFADMDVLVIVQASYLYMNVSTFSLSGHCNFYWSTMQAQTVKKLGTKLNLEEVLHIVSVTW